MRWETKRSFEGKLCQEYSYQNLIIGFQVIVNNVGDVFSETQCSFHGILSFGIVGIIWKAYFCFRIIRQQQEIDDLMAKPANDTSRFSDYFIIVLFVTN